MRLTARTTLTRSLLATLALALAVAVAGCAGGAGAGQGAASGVSPAARGSAGAASGSAGAGGAASGGGAAAAGGATAGGAAAAANMPAAARDLICPPPALGRLRPLLSQAIPAGFRPVAVVECLGAGGIRPVNGQWSYVQKQAAVAGLEPLLIALREPSARRAGFGPVPGCPILASAAPRLALIGSNGEVIYPRIPITVCGAPVQHVEASLAALHWIRIGSAVGPQHGSPPGVSAPQTAVRPSS